MFAYLNYKLKTLYLYKQSKKDLINEKYNFDNSTGLTDSILL
jgi:hypothetical protein